MNNFTTNTYEMKREIVNFSNKISEDVQNQLQSLFWICNMVYLKEAVA